MSKFAYHPIRKCDICGKKIGFYDSYMIDYSRHDELRGKIFCDECRNKELTK